MQKKPNQPPPQLSLVIPSFRAAEILRSQLPKLISWLESSGITHEVIVVDDGSKDGGATEEVARILGCKYIGLTTNSGKGAAVRKGMQSAIGRFYLFTDADIPFDLEAIIRFIKYLDFKEFHIVVGDRTLADSRYRSEISRLRAFSSALFTFIVGRFVTTGLFDTQCGLKGFQAEAARDLFGVARINGFAFDVELLYIALKRNYDIKRLPVTYRGDQGPSSVRMLQHGPLMLLDLFRIKGHELLGRYNKLKVIHEP